MDDYEIENLIRCGVSVLAIHHGLDLSRLSYYFEKCYYSCVFLDFDLFMSLFW